VRVAELSAPHVFRLVDAPLPDPGPGQVQVRVEAVGICGSDMHNFLEGSIGDAVSHYPMVLGHEPTGTVWKTGSGVTGWSPGDRAALEPAIYCYHCEFCRSGRHNICANIRFLSSPQEPGFFRERLNLPVESLLPLPPGVGLREGTLFEPLAVALHSLKLAALQPSETAAVYGAGPIGLMTILLLKLNGASRVWAIEPLAHRRELAKLMGADAVLDPSEGSEVQGVDLTLDCAAKAESLNQAVEATRNGGRLVITGIPAEVQVPLQWHTARRKELVIYNVRRSNHESEEALRLLQEQAGRFAPLLTHSFPLEKVQTAFELLESQAEGPGKVIVLPSS
jgi:L-iditol 2-dehydrogenase